MSLIDKHIYKLFNIRYASEDYMESVLISQIPTNEEIFSAIKRHLSHYSDISDYRFERMNDKWYKPTILVYDLQNNGNLFLRINP